jgi:hypothetical protein
MTTTRILWRMLDAQWVDTEPDVSMIALTMQANGKEYIVVCSGPKGMKSDEFIPAIVAAGTTLNTASGDSVRVGGPETDRFDTGDQRAS